MLRTLLTIAALCLFDAYATAGTLDEQLDIIREQLRSPYPPNMRIIGEAVGTINGLNQKTPSPNDEAVESLNPMWLSTQLREKGVTKAALSLCGGDLHSCKDASQNLKTLTAQCSKIFLGIIDIEKFPGTPKNLYDTANPELILLLQPPELKGLVPVGLNAATNPDTIAIMMCPEESRTFGPALRMMQNMQGR